MAGQTVGLAQLRRVRHGTGKPKQPRKTSFDEEKEKEDGAMARQRIAADMFKDAERRGERAGRCRAGSDAKALGTEKRRGKRREAWRGSVAAESRAWLVESGGEGSRGGHGRGANATTQGQLHRETQRQGTATRGSNVVAWLGVWPREWERFCAQNTIEAKVLSCLGKDRHAHRKQTHVRRRYYKRAGKQKGADTGEERNAADAKSTGSERLSGWLCSGDGKNRSTRTRRRCRRCGAHVGGEGITATKCAAGEFSFAKNRRITIGVGDGIVWRIAALEVRRGRRCRGRGAVCDARRRGRRLFHTEDQPLAQSRTG
ncbi:hypothetical protein ERJ75_001270000 [Trypanosoma vivax]|nr:hypothetical protein ERJ75_001270000 [Trypanosoma vivax]